MDKLKPAAYMHYFFAGSPPDDYYEDFELIKARDIGRYKDIQSNEAEGVVPLYAIPEGYSLVPDKPTEAMLDACSDVFWNTDEIELEKITPMFYKAMIKAAKEGE